MADGVDGDRVEEDRERKQLTDMEYLKKLVGELEGKLIARDEEIKQLKIDSGRVLSQKKKLEKQHSDLTIRLGELRKG